MLSLLTVVAFGIGVTSQAKLFGGPAKSLNWESCNYGDVVQNTCNTCTCSSKGVYDCEPRDCDLTTKTLNNTLACQPNKVYYQQGTYCICRHSGRWPHQLCSQLFKDLPEKQIKKKTCEPGGYVRIDCNICRCTAKGHVDTTRCTLNDCDEPTHRRSYDATSNMFGSCIARNWYSMGPCQICVCVDINKLICSTGVRKSSDMNLGQNALTHCGPDFLKQASALVPNDRIKTISQLIYQAPMHMVNPNIGFLRTNKNKNGTNISRNVVIEFDANMDTAQSSKPPRVSFRYPLNVLKSMMGARKTLTIDSRASCVPGTVTSVKCNICNCLTNGKMICSNHKC